MTDTARLRELEAKAALGPWYVAKDYGQLPETSRQVVKHTVWGAIAALEQNDE